MFEKIQAFWFYLQSIEAIHTHNPTHQHKILRSALKLWWLNLEIKLDDFINGHQRRTWTNWIHYFSSMKTKSLHNPPLYLMGKFFIFITQVCSSTDIFKCISCKHDEVIARKYLCKRNPPFIHHTPYVYYLIGVVYHYQFRWWQFNKLCSWRFDCCGWWGSHMTRHSG